MARKTFISYKYSEVTVLRDKIIKSLGDDAQYYQGEDGYSDDMSTEKAEKIRTYLADMIYGTLVTIVVISPNMTDSNWIDWEIKYSLKEITQEDKTSRRNGVVGIIQKVNGGYDWLTSQNYCHYNSKTSVSHNHSKMHPVIHKNRFNQSPLEYICEQCGTVNSLTGCYI